MHALYLASVFLHVVAAMTWIGGMMFLVLVVVPLLRRGDRARGAAFMRESGERFRTVGWTCIGVLVVTGIVNLGCRGVRPGDLVDAAWLATPFGSAIALKLLAFTLMVVVSAAHDFIVGPRATAAVQRNPASYESEALRRVASRLARAAALLALVVVALAVVVVRGWPA